MDYQMLVDMAVLAGEIMLVSGSDVYRVEDTVSRIMKQSGFESVEVFVLNTGIFATLSDPSISAITVVKRISKRSTNLNRIYKVNNVSRQFSQGAIGVEEAYSQLKLISRELQYNCLKKGIGYVMTSAFFAILFGGAIRELLAAAVVGAVLALTIFGVSKLRFNDFCLNAAAAFSAALMTLVLERTVFQGLNADAVIISAMMPLVPGVTFTSAIRDTLNGDYSSGSARMIEAIVVALAVAFGVGLGIMIFPANGGVL